MKEEDGPDLLLLFSLLSAPLSVSVRRSLSKDTSDTERGREGLRTCRETEGEERG